MCVCTASEKGELVLLDSRAALNAQHQAQQLGTPLPGLAELSASATCKVVAAHSKGSVSCLAAHQCAPLLATGTLNNVVKIWTDQCEPVSKVACTGPILTTHAHAATDAGLTDRRIHTCMQRWVLRTAMDYA